jgi:ankyrin repeat protein
LHTAALSGHANIVEELISYKADVDCEDTNGTTPLQIALEHKRQDFIQLLLKHSARTTGIMLAEWLDAYNRQASDAVFETSQMPNGKKSVQFFQERQVKVLTGTGPTRRLL